MGAKIGLPRGFDSLKKTTLKYRILARFEADFLGYVNYYLRIALAKARWMARLPERALPKSEPDMLAQTPAK